MNIEVILLILAVAGLIPWWVSRRITETRVRGRRCMDVRWRVQALFWRLTVRRPGGGRHSWQLSVPLIRELADAIWAAVRKLVQ